MKIKYVGFWIRFIAEFIDSTVLTLASWLVEFVVLGLIYGVLSVFTATQVPFFEMFNAFILQVLNIGFYLCLAFPYYTWGHFRWGTTLGKVIFGVYVVRTESYEPLTIRQSILRTMAYAISYLPVGAGYLMVAFHPEKRGLHDLIAGTVSIRRFAADNASDEGSQTLS